jgi:hypothetical protein
MGVPGSANLLLLGGEQGYKIERSLRFNRADTAYLNWTPAPGGGVTKCAVSMWVKRSGLGTSQGLFQGRQDASNQQYFGFTSSNTIEVGVTAAGSTTVQKITSAVYKDTSAWYHIFFYQDNTLATAEDRYQLYVNGVRVTAWGTNTNTAPQSTSTFYGSNNIHYIGAYGAANTFDGYITESHFIYQPATVPTVSDFGETDTITGVWKPKKYAGTYGTNGFYLNFSDNSGTTSTTLGKDSSGNSNNWTPNNFSVTAGAGNDSLIDTPTPYADGGNGRGNYCTGNPLYTPSSNSLMSLTNGNMEWGQAAINANSSMAGTFEMRSGKWYWEVTVGGSFNYSSLGIQTTTNTAWRGGGTVLYRSDGQKVIGGTSSAYGSSFTTNDVIGFAYDADAGSLTCYKNNTSQGVIYSSGTGSTWVPCAHDDNAGSGVTYYHQYNFGQRPFAYTPPSGFVALNTQNLPEPSIKKPSSYMDVKLYTGNNSTQTISGLGFSPDLVWLKSRSGAFGHGLYDTVRGATRQLCSHQTSAEVSVAGRSLTAFNSDGFSLNIDDASYGAYVNQSGQTQVAWCWDESATPGFDIVTYTGNGTARTIAHSLGVAPSMMIVKRRDSGVGATNWFVYHSRLNNGVNPAQYYLQLQSTNGTGGLSTVWNDTAPTSSVFSVGTSSETNGSGGTFVAYLWSEVAGFSKFGSYTGNGSSDGPFVFCGFRPRWLLFKNTSAAYWGIYDAVRNTYNTLTLALYPNDSLAELADQPFDFLSNGFKVRGTTTFVNSNGSTYVFAAFAEAPFKYALAR